MKSTPALRSPKYIVLLIVIVDLLGFGMIIPILPVISAEFLTDPGDGTRALVGLGGAALMASFSLAQMMFSPFWGRLSDRYGRRPILLMSLCGSTASYVLFAVSRSYELLLFSRLLAGVFGANITAAQAYMADITDRKGRTGGMGLIGMAFGIGFAFGPVLGGAATRVCKMLEMPPELWHVGPGVAAATICLINLIWAIMALPESLPPERRGLARSEVVRRRLPSLDVLRQPALGALVLLFFLVTFAFANLEVSFSIYAKLGLELDLEAIYGLFVFVGLLMALVQGGLVRRLSGRVADGALILTGIAILVLGLVLLPLWGAVPWVMFSIAVCAIGQGLCQPAILSRISKHASATAQGGAMGTAQAGSSLARVLGPIFGGVLLDLGPRWGLGLWLPFAAGAAVMGLAWIWAAATQANWSRTPMGEPTEVETV